jgi:hypothetical protein
VAARNHFRAHGRRRVDLAATMLVRPGASAEMRRDARAPMHRVRILNLGLGGACVELTDEGRNPEQGERARRSFRAEALRGDGSHRAGIAPTTDPARRPAETDAAGQGSATDGWRARGRSDGWNRSGRDTAAVEAQTDLYVETPVTLEVTAPTLWDPLVLGGKVAWVGRATAGRATRLGVRFEHREASAVYALFQLLGAHAFDV